MNTSALRTLLIYAVALPVAVLVGWMLTTPMDPATFTVTSAVLLILLSPVLLRWHYPIMVLSWNAFITIFFLPGEPALWMLMAAVNFGMMVVNRILRKGQMFFPAKSITLSLLAFALVVAVTAQMRGGFGSKVFGGASYGAKGYFSIFAAIVGYFALVSCPIAIERARSYMGLYFLSSVTAVTSNLIYMAGPQFYVLYLLFPTGFAATQASGEMTGAITRLSGFSTTASGVLLFTFALYGIRGIFDLRKAWRAILFLILLALCALGGYRSLLVLVGCVFIALFIAEGLLRSALFPTLLVCGLVGFACLIPIAHKLPLSMQRSLSFLPLSVDQMAKYDAQASLDWRLQMWRALAPDLPKYIWLGKGYSFSPADMFLNEESMRRGFAPNYSQALLVGDYHSGALSLYVPFGSLGVLAFVAFLIAAIRASYLNYKYGDERIRTINRFLFAYLVARVIFFFVFFGAANSDLPYFTGALGLSIALNKGIRTKPAAARASQPQRASLPGGLPRYGVA